MRCDECQNWTKRRIIRYADGERVAWEAVGGQGLCSVLSLNTGPEFFCGKFEAGGTGGDIVEARDMLPWEWWEMIPCPDCRSQGSENDGACYRCAGTANVRRYGDGFVGDERTRRHPMENQPPAPIDPGTILAPQLPPDVTAPSGSV